MRTLVSAIGLMVGSYSASMEPITIIGAGPVGLSLAVACIQRGIPVRVYEALGALVEEPRASTFHPVVLELMKEWGILDTMVSEGRVIRRLDYWNGPFVELVAQFQYSIISPFTDCPFRLQLLQHELSRILYAKVLKSPLAKVEFEHRLVGITQTETGVTAEFESPTGRKIVPSQYLCGADGSRSAVRALLEIASSGSKYEGAIVAIDTDIDTVRDLPQAHETTAMIFDAPSWVATAHLRRCLRFGWPATDGSNAEQETTDEAVRPKIERLAGRALDFSISRRTVYRVAQRTADTFWKGRCFLLGDAAHINHPLGGLGLNSGIVDANYLARALHRAVSSGDETGFGEYATARKRSAVEDAQRVSHQLFEQMSLGTSPDAIRTRNDKLRDTANDPVAATKFMLDHSMIGDRAPKS